MKMEPCRPICKPPAAFGALSFVVSIHCMQVTSDILSELQVGEFAIKLNHRRLLDAMMDICGVPASKFRPICR